MRRKQIHKGPKVQRDRTWIEVLPLDPRDADIVRAKQILQSKEMVLQNSARGSSHVLHKAT